MKRRKSYSQSRNPPLLPLSLALTSTPKPSDAAPATPTLAHILALLLPLNAYLPLSLDYLNRHSFEPESKDEDLHAGTLQLPPRTVVLVSDHGMEEGRLDQKGSLECRSSYIRTQCPRTYP